MKLKDRDKKHLWHPLTQHQLKPDSLAIIKAKGSVLTDEEGNEYIDAISSWYTCMYGHCNSYITSKVYEQMKVLDQIVFAGLTHKPAIELSEKLISILPKNQDKIFFSDNGSTSVEVAIKMALQYYFNQGMKRNVLIAFEEGFHGDTFGAMSVSDLSIYNGPFEEFFLDVKRIPVPTEDNINEVSTILENLLLENEVAAFVYEPLVQGAAAMKMHKAEHLELILEKVKSHKILCIADEVMTGFGKTGKNFASEYMKTKPDIICMSKSLSAGLLPLAITSCSQEIYNAFLSDDITKGFFHGHTYSANPNACTAAIAGIDLLVSEEIQENIKNIISWHKIFGEKMEKNPKIKSIRQQGVILALDLNISDERYGSIRNKLFDFFMKKGVFLRPLGNTVYILAPFTTSKNQFQKIYQSIEDVLEII